MLRRTYNILKLTKYEITVFENKFPKNNGVQQFCNFLRLSYKKPNIYGKVINNYIKLLDSQMNKDLVLSANLLMTKFLSEHFFFINLGEISFIFFLFKKNLTYETSEINYQLILKSSEYETCKYPHRYINYLEENIQYFQYHLRDIKEKRKISNKILASTGYFLGNNNIKFNIDFFKKILSLYVFLYIQEDKFEPKFLYRAQGFLNRADSETKIEFLTELKHQNENFTIFHNKNSNLLCELVGPLPLKKKVIIDHKALLEELIKIKEDDKLIEFFNNLSFYEKSNSDFLESVEKWFFSILGIKNNRQIINRIKNQFLNKPKVIELEHSVIDTYDWKGQKIDSETKVLTMNILMPSIKSFSFLRVDTEIPLLVQFISIKNGFYAGFGGSSSIKLKADTDGKVTPTTLISLNKTDLSFLLASSPK